jgi:uncharacterized protein
MPNLWIIFTTGLLTGGITCMAVQGGLLASTMAANKAEEKSNNAFFVMVFLIAKLTTHVLLGLILGALGSVLQFTPVTRAIFQGAVAIYMLAVAGALLDVHPFFRRFLIQTPRFMTKFIRSQSKRGDWFAPAILGGLTILIPCGTTQAMMALAISTGSPLAGAAVMGAFVLGTSPVFFVLGMAVAKLGEVMQNSFRKIAAWLVVALALYNLNGALVLGGSKFNIANITREVTCTISFCNSNTSNQAPTDTVNIEIQRNGYVVDNPVIQAGRQVTVRLKNTNGYGCVQAFTIPAVGVSKIVSPGKEDAVTFAAPDKPGKLTYSCGMGMYTGELEVVN